MILSICLKSSATSVFLKVISNRISAGNTSGMLIMYSGVFSKMKMKILNNIKVKREQGGFEIEMA